MSDPNDPGPKQLGFALDDARAPQSYAPDCEQVRAELAELLKTAKHATQEAPWDVRTFLYHKVVFPQMARWLPDDERDQFCFEFAQEVRRLELLMAA